MCWVMPPGLVRDQVGVPDRVEQLGLAVVDVTHDGDHRRPGHQVGVLALVLAELDVERLEQLPVLFLRGDHLDVVAQLGAEQLQRLVVHRLGRGDHLAEVEQHLHQRGRVDADLVGEVAQRRAAGQPDDLAVAARDPTRRRSPGPACCRTPDGAASSTCGRATAARRAGRTRPACRCDRGRRHRDGPGPCPAAAAAAATAAARAAGRRAAAAAPGRRGGCPCRDRRGRRRDRPGPPSLRVRRPPPTGRGGMLLGLGRGPAGPRAAGPGPVAGPPGPGRPGSAAAAGPRAAGRAGPGRTGLHRASRRTPPGFRAGWPRAPGWPGRARGAAPMPVAVELKGLLPGRGPGRGGPGVPRRARPGAGRARAGCRGPRPRPGPGGWARWCPGPALSAAAAAGRSRRLPAPACGNGTGGRSWLGASAGGPAAAGVSAAGVAAGAGLGWRRADRRAPGRGRSGPPCAVAGGSIRRGGRSRRDRAAVLTPSRPAPALGCWAANASLSLRTTGASIVEDADRTNSPISWSLAITALLSTPNSLASSYTRTFATALPLLGPARPDPSAGRGSACSVRRQLVLFIAACSSGAHRNLSLLSDRVTAIRCCLPAPPDLACARPGQDPAAHRPAANCRAAT